MEIKNTMKCQFTMIRRSKTYYIYVLVIYILFAFFCLGKTGYLTSTDDYIYRYVFQQVCIIFSNFIVAQVLINENFIRLFWDFMRLYVKNSRKYFYCTVLVLSLANIIPFIIGQTMAIILNYLHTGFCPVKLFFVNIAIVCMEIIIVNLLYITFSLLIKKNMLVYLFYIMLIFVLLILNNIYISIPLSMGVVDTQEYYHTFAAPLWIGRLLLIIIAGTCFQVVMNRFTEKAE